MGLQKFGDKADGKVLPEPGDNQKVAASNWTDEDQQELIEECSDDE